MKYVMRPFDPMLVALALVAAAPFASSAPAAAEPEMAAVQSREISAAKRYYYRRYPRSYAHAPRYYGRGNDPSLGPGGQPYRVPAYLRNQCYIDDGYGRFSGCDNR